jgi:kinesin family protein 1
MNRYAAATVDHSDDVPCSGRFILHQGIQRRIGITLCHESGSELIWKDVQEVVVGRIRGQRDSVFDESDGQVLSLNIISSHYIQKQHDERTFYHFEVAWDSSLHNSLLLNRCTSSGNSVYLTISSYLEIENSFQPAIITKDLCLVLYPRGGDSTSRIRSSLKNFFLSTNSPILNINDYSNRVSAVYELKLRRGTSMNIHSQDSKKIIDTSKIYVRGEEMLEGWRPRSDSLIIEHQQDLEKLYKIECVEYTKHFLQVKNRLENPLLSPNDNSPEKFKYSLISIDQSKPINNRQENLIRQCLSMMLPPPSILSKLTVPDIEVTTDRLSSDDFGTVHSLLKSTSTYSFTNLNTANMINSFIKASSSSSDLSRYNNRDVIVVFYF